MARAVSLKIERGCQNIVLRRRKNNLLYPEGLKFFSHTKHTFSWNLLDKVNPHASASTSQGSDFPKKISTFKNYNDIQNLFEQEESQRVCHNAINRLVNECDLVLACERFSSISIGDSPTVELYNCYKENINQLLVDFKKYQSSSAQEKQLIKPLRNSDEWSLVESFSSDSSPVEYYRRSDSSHAKNLQDDAKDDTSSVEPFSTPCSISMDVSTSTVMVLDRSIKCIQSISSRHRQQLENCGFHTVRKLLHHFPRTYADLENAHSDNVDGQFDGQYLILVGTVISSRGIKAGASFAFLEIVVCCELVTANSSVWNNENGHFEDKKTIYLHLKKFFRGTRFTHRPFLQALQSKYSAGDRVYVSGKVKKMQTKGHYEMREYTIDMLEPEEEANSHVIRRPYPIYPSKAGLRPSFLKDIITRTLKVIPPDIDPIPGNILKEFGLLNLHDAYHGIHCPRDKNAADLARRRLIFDEFFYLQLARLFQMLDAHATCGEKESLLKKYRNFQMNVVPMEEWCVLTKKFLKAIPYKLTPSQLNAVSEIIWDLKRPVPMNRLLQGDVGCGKTVVAFLSCMEVIGSGFQAAFMVPTELLAVQHYEQCMSFLGNISEDQPKPSVALLTGSTLSKQAQIIRQGLQTGDIAMVIGTHSLIAEKIEFSALRIAVIDEQHRFGVIQRGKFNSKLYSASASLNVTTMDESSSNKSYMAPHVLAMSATPIPRTLALALYGDMSLTQITELIPGRSAVETFVLEGNEIGLEKVYQMMKDELVGGGKVYLVYPLIEESEQLPLLRAASSDYAYISAKFEGYKCGLLHGKMKSEKKDETLKNFRSGDTHVLLATQLIEIGIDVPDASMMVVMNADRFGIAQLHQLRGRIGRGEKQSKCIFLSSTARTLDRLKVLEKSSDGFYLANIDLLVRGPGNLLGKKQSGHLPEFPIARLENDGNILVEAHHAALNVLSKSTDLESFPRLKAELSMRQPLCLLGD